MYLKFFILFFLQQNISEVHTFSEMLTSNCLSDMKMKQI